MNKVFEIINKELERQFDHIELIASENFVSNNVLKAQGSILTNKYAEGYPNKRYYGGCQYVDEIEEIAIESLKKLFNVNYANVQPHSGSQANMAAIRALINHGDTILGMALDQGGHLTHGHPLSFSGMDYNIIPYYVNKETEEIDYDEVLRIALEVKPKLIIAGASAYPRNIDFKKFQEIAKKSNSYLMVDMAHIAGLVAAGIHQNPCPYADVVTSTTHKTLRGPRGGIILSNNEEIINKINKMVFPGIQGGPLMHVIGAKAVAFIEALENDFIEYQKQVVKNAKYMAKCFMDKGYHVVSNGTDTHLILVDVYNKTGLTGKKAEKLLDLVNITVNKNTIPYDTLKPMITSGIRLGTPAITTRGLKEKEVGIIVDLIDEALNNYESEEILLSVKKRALELMEKYPLPYSKLED